MPLLTKFERIRGRYAPSPTGDLHLGNLRTALLAWLFARCAGGQFVMRIEDLDRPRVRPGATQRMLDDLRWLGLDWDEGPDTGGPYAPYIQSERQDIYAFYLQRLIDRGLVYQCYCTRAEIARIASAPHGEEGPRYPGACRNLTPQQRSQYEANNRRPSLRFRVDDERIVSFADLLAGQVEQHVQQAVGDFIICRSDGIFAYQFAVVVDDALMGINQVLRGADLLASTARQILLYEALGFPVPTFAHVPLVLDEQGKRLSKREQSAGLEPLRAAGASPAQVVGALAASCGLLEEGEQISAAELLNRYKEKGYDIMRSKLMQFKSPEILRCAQNDMPWGVSF
ncbi:MAG TPA: tRNA glutamyl-Q(34) synthetase GluQRS [Ktedonobacteraceae bacterium]|nr:tRNA glutamyl-Q(34) synthetase GluQRS [Ktedonobacteraceae bacterium]